MKHLILDCETMGADILKNDFVVLDFSAFVFDTDKMLSKNPYTTRSIADMKKFKMSAKDQIENYKYKVYNDTLKFWSEQSKEARAAIAPKSNDLSVDEFTQEFMSYVSGSGKISHWWSRSSSFDPLIIWRLMEASNKSAVFSEYLKHWKQRDIRTFIDAKLNFPKINGFVPIEDEDFWNKVFQPHNSSWDILADVLRFQAILRAEEDLGMVKR